MFSELAARSACISSPVPFWFLNGKITSRDMDKELRMMSEAGISSVVMHPRYGLDCEYLSEDYFQIFSWCLEAAKKYGVKLWIYDEINFPSATAGFNVTRDHPEYQSQYLSCKILPAAQVKPEDISEAHFCVAADMVEGKISRTTVYVPEQPFDLRDKLLFIFQKNRDRFYIDTLSGRAVERFRDLTYQAYYDRFSEDFGDTIQAFFTDEASVYWVSVGYDDYNIPYTDDIFETYFARYEEDPKPLLPYLFFEAPLAQRFRSRFWAHVGGLFSSRYHGTLSTWCNDHNVLYTGHNNHEEPLRYQIRFQGDMFASLSQMHIPGVDHLLKQTLGNYWNSIIGNKICSSQAHVSGKPRCMSESFGNVDWDSTFLQLKKIVDWQYGLGINLLVPHALFHTIGGQAKRESPPSFFYQSPLWSDFKEFGQYVKNLEKMLTGGRHACKVAVFYPLSGLHANYQPDHSTHDFEHIESFLNSLCLELMLNHVDYDIVDSASLRSASVQDQSINLAEESYRYLLIPVSNYLSDRDTELIKDISNAGVQTVLFFRSAYSDSQSSPCWDCSDFTAVRSEDLSQYICLLARTVNTDIALSGAGASDVMLLRREKDGNPVYFLVNRNAKHRKLTATLSGVQSYSIYNPETDQHLAAKSRISGRKTVMQIRLHPYQSIFLTTEAATSAPELSNICSATELSDITASIERNLALVFHFQYEGAEGSRSIDVRDDARMYSPNWVEDTSDPARFAGAYTAYVDVDCDTSSLYAVLDVEYSACQVYVNGSLLSLSPCIDSEGQELFAFVLDRSDVFANLSSLLISGRNEIKVISPNRLCEPFRITGRFGVRTGKVLQLVSDCSVSPFAPESSYPFHSGSIIYKCRFECQEGKYILDLRECLHSAEVWINGQFAGKRLWSPYRLDISRLLVTGSNEAEIIVRNNAANAILGLARPFGLRIAPALLAMCDNTVSGG